MIPIPAYEQKEANSYILNFAQLCMTALIMTFNKLKMSTVPQLLFWAKVWKTGTSNTFYKLNALNQNLQ